MLRYGFEIYQQLIKMFVRTNKRFPNPQEEKFLKNQAFRVRESLLDKNVNLEELSADEAIKLFSQPPRRRKPPTAEIYKPLEFGKKTKPKEGLEALDEAKVFDQFRDENTLTNLYRTQERALADGDIDTSRKIQKQIDAIIKKEPLSDFKDGGPVDKKDEDTVPLDPNEFDEMFRKMFSEWEWEKKKDSWKDKDYADGGRVEMVAGGITKIKKLAELAKKTKSKLGEAPKTDLKKVRARATSDKKSTEDLAKSEQIPVRDDTVKVKGETLDDGTPDYEYYRELLDNDEYDVVKGDETLEQLEAMLKEQDDYMKYMYGQYITGKLDPKPGEINRSRLNFLKNKAEEAEMSGRSKIITPDEIDELNFLEKKIRKMDLDEKVQDLNKKLTDEEISELRDLTDSGYANGGVATLFMER